MRTFVKNDNQQISLLDSTFNLTEREKRMLEKSYLYFTRESNIFTYRVKFSRYKQNQISKRGF